MHPALKVMSGPIVIAEWKETLYTRSRKISWNRPLEIEPSVHSRASKLIYASERNASYLIPMYFPCVERKQRWTRKGQQPQQ